MPKTPILLTCNPVGPEFSKPFPSKHSATIKEAYPIDPKVCKTPIAFRKTSAKEIFTSNDFLLSKTVTINPSEA